ncbi:PEP-CTERM sorting domain-containing protein [Lacipirellula sp.]|uniref:PEP-CTERM sorting domain-containing protein n=1 Tax=Lacipirellula sp. TaxID=2691419 RepID=UPI003D13CE29
MKLNMIRRCAAGVSLTLAICSFASAAAVSFKTVNLPARDLAYSSVSGMVYASLPDTSATFPNTLMPINPNTATLGTGIPIGFNPGKIAVSSNGANLFTVIGGDVAVQRYNVPSASTDQFFAVSGGPRISEIYGVPGRPNAVLFHEYDPGTSPPAVATVVYENGVLLPNQVGHGVGVGGPDIIAVDPTDGTKAYGYQNTISSYDHVPMTIGPNGIVTSGPSSLSGIMNGSNIGRIAIVGDRLFNDRGQIYSRSLGIQLASFQAGQSFVIDVAGNKFFTVASSGTTQTLRAYSLSTLTLLQTDTVSPVSGTASSLTRFGDNGLAFRTSAGQVVFVGAVPEPTSLALGSAALLLGFAARKRVS